jgi:hypothetical protein
MIKNFEEVTKQLRELAEVVNAFKSEAVQLRLIDLIFGIEVAEAEATERLSERSPGPGAARKRRRKTVSPEETPDASATATLGRVPRAGSRPGGKATLAKLYEGGFFKTPRTIKDIVAHADTNMALKFNQQDFSSP